MVIRANLENLWFCYIPATSHPSLAAHEFSASDCGAPLSSPHTLLLSERALQSGCARLNTPATISTSGGNNINITLYDLSGAGGGDDASSLVYGVIRDVQTDVRVEMRASRRQQQLMTSASHNIEITFYTQHANLALEISGQYSELV